jgi:DNA-binding transcriptional regulator YiaG
MIADKPKNTLYPACINTIGDLIRTKRLDMQLSQVKLAKMLGVDPDTIRLWEKTSRVPKRINRIKIYKKLWGSKNE